MRKLIAGLAVSAVVMTAAPALAGGYYHYGYKHHHHGGHGYYVAGALLAGLVIGNLLTKAATPRVVHKTTVVQSPYTHCRQTTGTSRLNGRVAQYAGTICYDAYGRAYIIRGSERFLGYLQ